MNGDFFNRIGVADMEKVHSAVIGWMFSNDCKALTANQKSELLCGLFNVTPVQYFKDFRVEVEHHNIDVIIITDEKTNPKCWVIENKIKSSQHSNQLDKYVDIVQGKPVKIGRTIHQITDYLKMAQYFCFLTLINERPQYSKNVSWVNKTYKEFALLLSNYNLSSNPVPDAVILNEYLECIQNLANALDDFLKDHQNYPNVFLDGAKQNNPKLKTNAQAKGTYANFIAENGLETIFQKCFLSHIMRQTQHFQTGFSIFETHGTALAGKTLIKVKGTGTELGIQFQNGTFKVQVLGPDTTSNSVFWNKWNPLFPLIEGIIGPDWKRNNSKRLQGRYFSYSKRKNRSWYKKAVKGIAKEWDGMYQDCLAVLNVLQKYC